MSVKHLVIVGPTASSKSDLAVAVAESRRPSTEIISLDSMQIFKSMEVGTGVLPIKDRRGIKHHMISVIDPTSNFSAKQFQVDVYRILNENPTKDFVLVGGTGLYTHSIIDGFEFAPTQKQIREMIIEEYDLDEENPNDESVLKAYEHLSKIDPLGASKIDPKNVRRIIRSLEAYEISGRKFSETGEGITSFGEPVLPVQIVGIRYTRENLKRRVEIRVNKMFEQGWVEEVKQLMNNWDEVCAPAQNAIGYRQIKTWIENGEKEEELEATKELIVNKTMQFSRRQRKWFERDPRITWIDCDDLEFDVIVETIKRQISW